MENANEKLLELKKAEVKKEKKSRDFKAAAIKDGKMIRINNKSASTTYHICGKAISPNRTVSVNKMLFDELIKSSAGAYYAKHILEIVK